MDPLHRHAENDEQPDRPQHTPRSLTEEELRWAGITNLSAASSTDDRVANDSVEDDLSTDDSDNVDASVDPIEVAHPADGVAAPFRGDGAALRIAGTERALDDAMEAWLSADILPNPAVLRDGLLLLNAGEELDEGQRALLLRSALYHRRGILTALSYQADLERSALILHDAIVEPAHPLPLTDLERLLHEDPSVDRWESYLHAELLSTARSYDTGRSRLADAALLLLDTGEIVESNQAIEHYDADDPQQALGDIVEELEGNRSPFRQILLITLFFMLVLAIMATAVMQYERSRIASMATIPAGEYMLANGDGSERIAAVDDILVDMTEVTNRQYRRCLQRGKCPPPSEEHSVTRDDYLNDPAFDQFPVIHVDRAAANAYCRWAGKRLPTTDEWQVAASLAPATARTYLYPWGDRYLAGAANDVNAEHGDTLAVGAYRPGGDSPLGLADMAGNVAEWTSIVGSETSDFALVKGGSYRDSAEFLRADRFVEMPVNKATETVGFRCATKSLASAILDKIR